MAKIVLGKRPESFKRPVKFQDVDGTEGQLEAVFKYRTMEEFGEMYDEWTKEQEEKLRAEKAKLDEARAAAEVAGETFVEPVQTSKELRRAQAEANADYLLRFLVGWNLDVEVNRDALVQLANEFPGASAALMNDYRVAITEGRVGN